MSPTASPTGSPCLPTAPGLDGPPPQPAARGHAHTLSRPHLGALKLSTTVDPASLRTGSSPQPLWPVILAEVAPPRPSPGLTTSTLLDRGSAIVVGAINEADYRPRRVVLDLLREAADVPE